MSIRHKRTGSLQQASPPQGWACLGAGIYIPNKLSSFRTSALGKEELKPIPLAVEGHIPWLGVESIPAGGATKDTTLFLFSVSDRSEGRLGPKPLLGRPGEEQKACAFVKSLIHPTGRPHLHCTSFFLECEVIHFLFRLKPAWVRVSVFLSGSTTYFLPFSKT